jgi:signal transduction histidine kinase
MQPDGLAYPGTELIRNYLLLPIILDGRVAGVVALGRVETEAFTEEHLQWAEALVNQAAVAIQNSRLFQQVQEGREQLQLLSRRLVEIQETERRFISRELHDRAGQALTSLILGLAMLEKKADDPAYIQARTSELKVMADNVLEELHDLAVNLRPASLDQLGLVAALEQLIKSLTQNPGPQIHFKAIDINEDERLSQDTEITLYRIAQEALTNVVRHAQANYVDVVLERRGDIALILIEDDGKGFNAEMAKGNQHLGLLDMQERTKMVGGTFILESTPGKGTTLVVEVPYVNPNPRG